jgi:tetratricopeptide (TPR) repeat protein
MGASEFHTRGRKLMQEDHYADAIVQFTEAIKLDASLPLVYNGRGYSYLRLKRYAQAIADFDEAIKLNPAYSNAYMNRSAAKRSFGDAHGADADTLKARELAKASQ